MTDPASEIILKYAVEDERFAPRPIKPVVPGWSGEAHERKDGSKPQPWHCMPFMDGALYGLELIYPYDTECTVIVDRPGEIRFVGNWPAPTIPGIVWPPFQAQKPNHYTFYSFIHIRVPDDYVLRIEPHPRFFTDLTNTIAPHITGHLQSAWWPKRSFAAFRRPEVGQRHIFRPGDPYAQLLVVPRKSQYKLQRQTKDEDYQRQVLATLIEHNRGKIAKTTWIDESGEGFDDRYKVLARTFTREGVAGVERLVMEVSRPQSPKPPGGGFGSCSFDK